MKSNRAHLAVMLAAALSAAGSWTFAAHRALSTPFLGVTVRDIPLGQDVAIHDKRGWPLIVNNTGGEPLRVRVVARIPIAAQMRPGYKPIPDAAWIRIEPDVQIIPPYTSANFAVSVHVPSQRAYARRHYMALLSIRGRSPEETGLSIEGGLLVRLRLSTARK